jgi:hypothetical protein
MIDLRKAAVFLLLVAAAGQAASKAAPTVEVIATGLNNPRGIAFAPDGRLYVAEAGRGSTDGTGNCITTGDRQQSCYGETGAITRIDPSGADAPERVVTGLPSIAPASGAGAGGPLDIAFLGNGNAQVVLGLGATATARATLGGKGYLLGRVLQVNAGGGWKAGADIAAFEEANNPVPGGADSNPYGVAALPSRHLVADAGANALFEVRTNGQVQTLAAFPARQVPAPPFLGLPPGATIPMQAVPTTVVQGPDGWLYVGQLTGFPFPVGGANIYRVPSQGGVPDVAATGFTNIIDMAFDRFGTLYVLQIGNGLAGPGGPPLNAPGTLIRVNPNGTQTVIYANLFYPGGLAIGPDGAAYVTNFGILPGGGQVLRIELD